MEANQSNLDKLDRNHLDEGNNGGKNFDDSKLNEAFDAKTYDAVLKSVGAANRFQWLIYFYVILVESTVASSVYFFVFEGANPGYSCPGTNSTKCFNEKPCDNFTFNDDFTSIVTEWNLICQKQFIPKLITSTFFGGVLVGSLFAGQLADLFGRKPVLNICWTGVMVCQLCLIWIPSLPVYITFRFMSGVFAGGTVTVTSVLGMEYSGGKFRLIMTYRLGWTLGPLILTLIAWIFHDWRKTAIASALVSFPFYPILVFIVPESSRWLLRKGQVEKAYYWMSWVAKINGRDPPKKQLLERIAETEAKNVGKRIPYSYLSLCHNPQTAKIAFAVCYGWFSSSLVSYGLTSQMSSFKGDLYSLMAIKTAITGLTRWINVVMIQVFGRKKSFAIFMLPTGLFLLVCMVLNLSGVENGLAVTVLAMFAMLFVNGCWSVIIIYGAENHPTLMRNIINGAGNASARVGGILAPQIGLLGTYSSAAPFAVYVFIALSSSIYIYLVIPETKGKPLPEHLPGGHWPCIGPKNGNNDVHIDTEMS